MQLCQIILLTRRHMPASKYQFLDDTKIKKYHLKIGSGWLASQEAGIRLCVSQMIWQSGIFLLFLWYILIFWAQKCWFIELNLTFGSDGVCILYSICITFLSFPAPAVNCIYQYETYILPHIIGPSKENVFWALENMYCILCM